MDILTITQATDITIQRWMLGRLLLVDSGGATINCVLPDTVINSLCWVGNVGTGILTVGTTLATLNQGEMAFFVLSAGMWVRLQESPPVLRSPNGHLWTQAISNAGAVSGGTDLGAGVPNIAGTPTS